MPKQTKKYTQAVTTLKALSSGRAIVKRDMDHDEIYPMLERCGYRWNSKQEQWEKFQASENAPKTGHIDIRIRANTGDVERAAWFIGQALEAAGFKTTRLSAPDPDDRHGPATTARVYLSGLLPDETK
jgi:hypothetical protein